MPLLSMSFPTFLQFYLQFFKLTSLNIFLHSHVALWYIDDQYFTSPKTASIFHGSVSSEI